MRKRHLPSLKRLQESQEPAETFFGDGIIGRHHFCNAFYIAGEEAGRCHFLCPLCTASTGGRASSLPHPAQQLRTLKDCHTDLLDLRANAKAAV